MAYILDGIILLLMALTVFFGYRHGFLKSVVQIVGFIAAFVLALTFSSPLASWTFDGLMAEGIETQLNESLVGVTEVPSAEKLGELLTGLPTSVISVLENSTQLQSALDSLDNSVAATTATLANTLLTRIIRPIVVSLLQFVFFIILFVLFSLVARLLTKLIKPVTKLPLIRQIDGTLGAVLGAIKGVLLVLIFTAFVQLIAATGTENSMLSLDSLDKTFLTRWVLSVNPILSTIH